MAKFNVGDRFYFPVQEDGDYEACWNKTGVIEGIQNVFDDVFADIILDNGLKRGCLLRRLQPIEEARFTKDDLKTGMLVQTSDEIWWVVIRENGCHKQSKDILIRYKKREYIGWNKLDLYAEDLSYTGQFPEDSTIIKIASCDYFTQIFTEGIDVNRLVGFKVIWERPKENPKVIQLESLCLKLESQLEDAREELRKIKGESI